MLSPELVLRERLPGLAELGERMVVDVSGIGGRSPCEQCEGVEQLEDLAVDVLVLGHLNSIWDT